MLPFQSGDSASASVVSWYATDRLTRVVLPAGSAVYITKAIPSPHVFPLEESLKGFRLSRVEAALYTMALPCEFVVTGSTADFRGFHIPPIAFMRMCRVFKNRHPEMSFTVRHDTEHPLELALVATSGRGSYLLVRMGAVYEYKPFARLLLAVMSSRCEDFSWSSVPQFAQLVLLQALAATPGYILLDRSKVAYCTTVLPNGRYCYKLPKRFKLVGTHGVKQLCVCSGCETVTEY